LILAFAPVLHIRGPWQIQIDRFRRTLDAFPGGEVATRVRLMGELAEGLWYEGKYEEAYRTAVAAVHLAESTGSDQVLAEALLQAGEKAKDSGKRQEAMEHFVRGASASERCKNGRLVAQHNAGRAAIHDRHGQYDRALALIRAAVAAVEPTGDVSTLAFVANRQGVILWHKGEPEAAIESLARAETLFRAADNLRWIAGVCTNQGLALIDCNRAGEALERFRTAAPIHLANGNVAWWAVNQGGAGQALLLLGELDQAAAVLNEALQKARETGYKENEGMILGLLARVHTRRGDWAEAERTFDLAMEIEGRLGSQDRRFAGNLLNRALARHRLGKTDAARSDWAAGVALADRLGLSTGSSIPAVRADMELARLLAEELQ
jgi:tetratricopeptide (TPR) repeat protein